MTFVKASTVMVLATTVGASVGAAGCGSDAGSGSGTPPPESDGGGGPTADATAGDAGNAAAWSGGTCAASAATFELDVPAGAVCTAGPSCEEVPVVTVIAADGTSLAATPCFPNGHCAQPTRASSPLTASWDGTFYVNCNDVATKACAKAGHYTARFCGYADRGDGGATCAPASAPSCVDVPFDWPTTGPVKATLSL